MTSSLIRILHKAPLHQAEAPAKTVFMSQAPSCGRAHTVAKGPRTDPVDPYGNEYLSPRLLPPSPEMTVSLVDSSFSAPD